MQQICHRCGGELDDRCAFCPHCGAPQLLLSDYTEPLSTGAEAAASTGTLPPPHPNQIDWRMAVRCAAAVAAVAAVLGAIAARFPNLGPVSMVWMISASLTTLALYQRRRPLASMSAGVGAKIGIIVGIAMVLFLGAALSVGMVVARYALHDLAEIDAKSVEDINTLKARMGEMGPTRPVPPEVMHLMDSVEFRTSLSLLGYAIGLTGVLVVSIFGGAIGGLLRTRRFSPKA